MKKITFLFILLVTSIGFSQTLLSVTNSDDVLRTIDPSDASTLSSVTITLPGETVNGGTGLATNPNTGQLWAILKVSGFSGRALVTLNPTTGVATLVGDTGDRFAGIAFNAAGTLFGVTGDGTWNPNGSSPTPESLFTLNTTNGSPTFVCALGNGTDGETIGFNPNDGLIYHASGHDSSGVIFESINNIGIDPCGVTNINISGTVLEDEEVQALTWDPSNNAFFWKQGHWPGPLYSVTPTGVATLIGNMDHQAKGLAFFGGFCQFSPDIDPLPDLTDECSINEPTAPTANNGAITAITTTIFPITTQGTTTITWTYDIGNGNTETQTQNVVIEDLTAPVLTGVTNPIVLWPPNHMYDTIALSQLFFSVSDNCAALSIDDVHISAVSSDEEENAQGGGDGNTVDDIVIAPGCQSVQLRKERRGNGNGRVYTINLAVDDGNGNTGVASVQVYVPHSIGGTAIDDGVAYFEVCDNGLGPLSIPVTDYDIDRLLTVDDHDSYTIDVKFWPNPTTGVLTVQSKTAIVQIEIYNQLGQLILSNTDQNTIDISKVSQGIYFIKVKDENGNFGAQKIVKK